MSVLVSDSSVLIELSKRGLLDKMFQMEFRFAVPDVLFHEELIDLGRYSRQDLLDFGLEVESLDSEGVEAAISYQSSRPALSLVDAFAIALADHRGWQLLTEDRAMRSVARSEGIANRDTLWVIDNMMTAGILPAAQAVSALEEMRDDPRCPVPNRELDIRLRRLRA